MPIPILRDCGCYSPSPWPSGLSVTVVLRHACHPMSIGGTQGARCPFKPSVGRHGIVCVDCITR
eukprot:scaffold119126_cov31-Tisochrysis_lutea.AAC.2